MPDAATTPKKRGPNTPEGKARSSRNALKHGLRARDFVLLPEEDPQEWSQHVQDLEHGYRPVDATERKLVDAIAVAMWKEIRADRFEAEVLTDIPPRSKDRSHGSDLQVPDHAAALTTAIRYQGSAGMAARRAVRAFLEHRKAKQTGLLLPACTREPEITKNTNDLSAAPLGRALPPSPPPGEPPPPAEPDPDAWLADVPVVEADPSDESLRRSLLGMIEHPILREIATKAPLKSIEQLIVASDDVAYEEWFAKQPKVPFGQVDLPDSLKADIEEVTKHNPPWMRGPYLSYYRPPVPAHLFDPDYANDAEPGGRAGRDRAAAGRDHPVPARAARPPARPQRRAAARGARPRRGGLRHQMAEMARLSRPDRSRPAAKGAGWHRHRRADAQLARRQGDRAGVPGGVIRPRTARRATRPPAPAHDAPRDPR